MTIPTASDHVALMAIAGAITSTCLNTAIEDYLEVFVNKSQALDVEQTLAKCLVSSLALGLFLSIIFYFFAMYGFPNAGITPVQIIGLFSLFVAFGFPLLGFMLQSIYTKIFA